MTKSYNLEERKCKESFEPPHFWQQLALNCTQLIKTTLLQ